MSFQYVIFPDPLTNGYTLRHDTAGWLLTGVPTVHPSGRPGIGFTIPDGTPDEHGIELIGSGPGYYDFRQRGILRLLADGTARTDMDDFRMIKKAGGSSGLGRLQPDGVQFKDHVWAQMTGFCDYQLWLTGRQGDCRALGRPARDLGANGRR